MLLEFYDLSVPNNKLVVVVVLMLVLGAQHVISGEAGRCGKPTMGLPHIANRRAAQTNYKERNNTCRIKLTSVP